MPEFWEQRRCSLLGNGSVNMFQPETIHVTSATHTHETIEELPEAVFSLDLCGLKGLRPGLDRI
jgi:hypothetical protein